MSIDEKYFLLIDQIVTVSIADQTRILGITSPRDDNAIPEFTRILAKSFVLTGIRTLLVNFSDTATMDTDHKGNPGAAPDISTTFIGKDEAGLERMEINLNKNNRFVFNDMTRIRAFIDKNLGDYGIIILDLPGILSRHPGTINTASCASACDGVYLICKTGEITRPDLTGTREQLGQVGASLKGVILNNNDHTTTGQGMARQARQLGWIPGMTSLASRLEKLEFLG